MYRSFVSVRFLHKALRKIDMANFVFFPAFMPQLLIVGFSRLPNLIDLWEKTFIFWVSFEIL